MKTLKDHAHLLILMGLTVGTLGFTSVSQAQKGHGGGQTFDFRKKAESKAGQRWTLQEWLEQKNRNYMMDLWLGMYAPSPYEFFVSGAYDSYDLSTSIAPSATADTKASHKTYSGSVGAFATIIGLIGEHENNTEEGYNDTTGSFNLRILGNAVQGTHLMLQYGLRTHQIDNSINQTRLNQQFAGADLDLYLMRHFGLHGNYRSFMPYTEAVLGETKGTRTEAGAFLDFGPVRVYGNWYSEKQDSTLTNVLTHTDRTGIQSGLKFFF